MPGIQDTVLPIVIFLVMITVGLELSVQQFRVLFREPRLPLIGTLIHSLTFPLIAAMLAGLILWLDIPVAEATLVGMLLIAACPSGGFSNILAMIARANLPLSITLTAVSSLISFITVPLLMWSFAFLMSDLSSPVEIPVAQTLAQLFVLLLIPTALGMLIRFKWPANVDVYLTRLQKSGQGLLYVTVGLLIVESRDTMIVGFGDALPWSLLLCCLNIGACLCIARLCGLSAVNAVTVALEGSIRNVGIAFLIAANVMQRMDIAVLPTVYLLAVLLVAIAFAKTWHLFLSDEPD